MPGKRQKLLGFPGQRPVLVQKRRAPKGNCRNHLKDSLKGTGTRGRKQEGHPGLGHSLSLWSKVKPADICRVLSIWPYPRCFFGSTLIHSAQPVRWSRGNYPTEARAMAARSHSWQAEEPGFQLW